MTRHSSTVASGLLGLLVWTWMASACVAGMKETLDAIRDSEFRFARSTSEVPFMPTDWFTDSYYPNSRFEPNRNNLADATVGENTLDLGGVMPAYVARRDMLVLGGDAAWDYVAIKSGPYPDQSVMRLTPIAAWLHQFGSNDTVGAFAAPIFSKEFESKGPWGASVYAGLIDIHWFSDKFQLLYGGVYEYSFGQHTGYPYLGVNWQPTPRCSVALVFPWPTIAYAPANRWLFSVGVSPGGSTWAKSDDSFEATESLSSWNVTARVGYRFYGNLWLAVGAGLAGWRAVDLSGGNDEVRFESKPGPMFTFGIEFRP